MQANPTRCFTCLVLPTIIIFFCCVEAARPQSPQPGAKVLRDVVYSRAAARGSGTGFKDLSLDLYLPNTDAPEARPVIVALHGGAFKAGDKAGPEGMADACEAFSAKGYVCASINYRLEADDPPTEGATPHDRAVSAAVEDAAKAVAWLRKNAKAYSLDPKCVVLMGRSSGAGAAMRLAYSGAGRKLGIRAVVEMSGALHGELNRIQRGDAPLCIIHGTNDTLVPVAEARALAARAEEVGVPYEIYLLEGRGNGHVKSFAREVDDVSLLDHAVGFLRAHSARSK
jgi:acetyl esterase/lipase